MHAFATDPTRGVFILGLLGIVIGGSLLLFAFRAPVLAASGIFAPLSREGALVLNNVLLCSIAAVVITGTMYPLIADFVFDTKISVGAPFFNATVLPLTIPVFAAMVVAPGLAWKRARLGPALFRLWWAALAAAIVGAFAAIGPARLLPALAFAASAWMILGAFAEIVERTRLFRLPIADSLARLAGLRLSVFGTTLGHAGMGVLVAGVAGMSLASEKVVLLKPGESALSAGYTWTLDGVRDQEGPNYEERIATMRISRDGVTIVNLEPSRRAFPVQRMTTTEAAIHTNGLADIYAVLGEERDGAALMRLHYNPLAPWIWFGGLIMVAGGGLSLLDRRARVGAPARAKPLPGSAPA